MTNSTQRFTPSALSHPMPVYIPSRLARRNPGRRHETESQQQVMHNAVDPTMHKKDVDYVASLFVAEQLDAERSETSEQNENVSESPAENGDVDVR